MITARRLGAHYAEALDKASEYAPYLKRALGQLHDIGRTRMHDQKGVWAPDINTDVKSVPSDAAIDDVMQVLRRSKLEAHLAIAAQDFTHRSSQADVTLAITAFADAAVQAALTAALHARDLSQDGIFIIALGKMGAGELNYSSDIDIAAFYDPEVFDGGEREPGDAAMRVIRDLVRILNEYTGDGYVFRTDLRLRPDPSSTPLCVSTQMAETYYESVGQNWERMAWIKARACAGDMVAAERFLETMQPFVWRRHLDYWAIGDIHAIKNMVNSKAGHPSLSNPAADVKLGPGGIREIEFFAQTQQLILGGRNPKLRARGTIDALHALAEEGVIAAGTAEHLTSSYHTLRAVEHRIQMLNDQQTHTLPENEGARSNVAALMGYPDLAEFDQGMLEIRKSVHKIYSDLFADEERRTAEAEAGNLVFTGVDDDPGTVETLLGMGFKDPSFVIERIRRWHRGHISATRTSRGRGLLTALLPSLLKLMSETGEPETAFRRFVTFFEHLPSGVQTLSMLLAERDLLEDLVATLALSPRLATHLGRKPALLEALIDGGAAQDLSIPEDANFEQAMDYARRYHRDQSFLIGHRLLHGRLAATEAGRGFSDLADKLIIAMAAAAETETVQRFGPKPGEYVIGAFGKLGGRELSMGSDLDLIVIFDAPQADSPQRWFTKFTQRLITALSVPTGEGDLYEVDMRLRPSGNSGPVAASLPSFERYHFESAWTWEHMALTRLRLVAGNAALMTRVAEVVDRVLAKPRDHDIVKQDIFAMRQRLAEQKPGTALWELKTAPGGLIDIEFLVQQGLLLRGQDAVQQNTRLALKSLMNTGDLAENEASLLLETLENLQSSQQIIRLAVGAKFEPETASAGLKARLARGLGVSSFEKASSRLAEGKKQVAAIRCKKIGPIATD